MSPSDRYQITALQVYPVKSLRGISLAEARLTRFGLQHDRRFMLIRGNGRFVTQREHAKLALIDTQLRDGKVVLGREGFGEIELPDESGSGPIRSSRVWNDECQTIDCGDDVAAWITAATESKNDFRIVHMAPGFIRPQSQPEHFGKSTSTYFADAAPILLTNENSLQSLNKELASRGHSKVSMGRFRPNIVINGMAPFAEHAIEELHSDHFQLALPKPCERCVITTINQQTAEPNERQQPLKTLRDINPVPGKPRAPAFGQNATVLFGEENIVRCGDMLFNPANQ